MSCAHVYTVYPAVLRGDAGRGTVKIKSFILMHVSKINSLFQGSNLYLITNFRYNRTLITIGFMFQVLLSSKLQTIAINISI